METQERSPALKRLGSQGPSAPVARGERSINLLVELAWHKAWTIARGLLASCLARVERGTRATGDSSGFTLAEDSFPGSQRATSWSVLPILTISVLGPVASSKCRVGAASLVLSSPYGTSTPPRLSRALRAMARARTVLMHLACRNCIWHAEITKKSGLRAVPLPWHGVS